MSDWQMEIWEVRYPDKRQEGGLSTALFRNRVLADQFAKRYNVTPAGRMIGSEEYNRLRILKKFEAGT